MMKTVKKPFFPKMALILDLQLFRHTFMSKPEAIAPDLKAFVFMLSIFASWYGLTSSISRHGVMVARLPYKQKNLGSIHIKA